MAWTAVYYCYYYYYYYYYYYCYCYCYYYVKKKKKSKNQILAFCHVDDELMLRCPQMSFDILGTRSVMLILM